jgi:RNA-directed DNA polymerase
MLQALATGVKGNVWFSLIDKVWSKPNLRCAWEKVRKNGGAPGPDGVTVERFARHLDERLDRLHEDLKTGAYQPDAVRRAYVEKLGTDELRPLGIPNVADRVVQGALRHVLEPIFERKFLASSYGFRPEVGAKDALRVVERGLKNGVTWVVEADFRRCFDSIPHAGLLAEVRREIGDGRVLVLIEQMLRAGVMEAGEYEPTDEGTPQGGVISPLFANVHLHPLDVACQAAGLELVRYADDFVLLCRTKAEAERALALVHAQAAERGLTLHPDKTGLVDVASGGAFEFLGYRFVSGKRWPRGKSEAKLRDRVRAYTKRSDGGGLDRMIRRVNLTLEGWFAYFRHSTRGAFGRMDGWIRRRLRSVLCKHLGKGRMAQAGGSDHQRWPNDFFRQRGLFILTDAHVALLQSIATR